MTEQEWLACEHPDQMLAHVGERLSNRKLRLLTCAAARAAWVPMTEEQRTTLRALENEDARGVPDSVWIRQVANWLAASRTPPSYTAAIVRDIAGNSLRVAPPPAEQRLGGMEGVPTRDRGGWQYRPPRSDSYLTLSASTGLGRFTFGGKRKWCRRACHSGVAG